MALTQLVAVRCNTSLLSTTNRFLPLVLSKMSSTEDDNQSRMPAAGTISNVRIEIDAAVGVGNSYTLTLKKNKVATALAITISGGSAVSGTDVANSISYVAGDVLSWNLTLSGTPNKVAKNIYFELSGATSCSYVSEEVFSNATRSGNPLGFQGSAAGGSALQSNVPCPVAGTFVACYLRQDGVGSTGSWTWMLNKNGTDQDGAGGTPDTRVTMNSAVGVSIQSGTFSCSVAAGDLIYAKITANSTPSSSGDFSWGYAFTPTDGLSCPLTQASGAGSGGTSGTEYLECVTSTYNATVNSGSRILSTLLCSRNFQISALYCVQGAASGAAKARAFTLGKNGSNTSLSASIGGASAVTANDTAAGHKVTVSSGDTLSMEDAITGTSVGGTTGIGFGLAIGIPGGGKGAGGGNSNSGKKGGGGGLNVINPGGATFIQIGNTGLDVGVTS